MSYEFDESVCLTLHLSLYASIQSCYNSHVHFPTFCASMKYVKCAQTPLQRRHHYKRPILRRTIEQKETQRIVQLKGCIIGSKQAKILFTSYWVFSFNALDTIVRLLNGKCNYFFVHAKEKNCFRSPCYPLEILNKMFSNRQEKYSKRYASIVYPEFIVQI